MKQLKMAYEAPETDLLVLRNEEGFLAASGETEEGLIIDDDWDS